MVSIDRTELIRINGLEVSQDFLDAVEFIGSKEYGVQSAIVQSVIRYAIIKGFRDSYLRSIDKENEIRKSKGQKAIPTFTDCPRCAGVKNVQDVY